MITKEILTPTSRVNMGYATVDITPPVGIYNRMWGAAKYDTAIGIHMPLRADAIYLSDLKNAKNSFLRIQLDLVYLDDGIRENLIQVVAEKLKIGKKQILVTSSHTHAAGMWCPDRFNLPGGDILKDYLSGITDLILPACEKAFANIRPVEINYSQGWCDMVADRDSWDENFGGRVCGFNPGVVSDKTVSVGRVTTDGKLYAIFVNYACHATTLAFENRLISPDYIGPMRKTVEEITNVPCIFFQGASGNLGPKYGFVGGTKIAEKNGRWLGYSALSALEGIAPPGEDYIYRGPVISGATLGVWDFAPMKDEHIKKSMIFEGGMYEVGLPRRAIGTEAELKAECLDWEEKSKQAEEAGQSKDAIDYRARAERARRWVTTVKMLPEKGNIPYYYSVYRLGDAFWITVNGEPYSKLQTEIRKLFPDYSFFISGLEGQTFINYLLEEESYGKGLYQEEPAVLAKGCLEIVIEKISEKINELIMR